MDSVIRWFKAVTGVMFKSRMYQYTQRIRAKFSRATTGRVQKRIQDTVRKADRKVNSAMDDKKKGDKKTGDAKKKK